MSRQQDGNDEGGFAVGDGALVRAARKGRLDAMETLVNRYQRRVTGLAFRLLNDREEAMDTAQDAFLKAHEKLGTLSQPDRFGPWLMRIVSNLALNRRRARALRRTLPLEQPSEAGQDRAELAHPDPRAVQPVEAASAQDLQRLIEQALSELPEMQRQALVLFSIEQMPQKEVADLLDCSVEAVKWHVFAARKKLKDRLKDYL